jgi:NADPH2:quinone reductase
MKVWVGSGAGAGVTFQLSELPVPKAGPGEVLIRVKAAGINRVDQFPSLSHFSHSPPSPIPIPGLEAAGEVIEVGEGVTGYHGGERIAAMVQGGCAEFVRVNAALAMPLPDNMSWAAAAALPVSYLTAHNALFALGQLPPGGSVLIHAVTSGVGIAALQIAALHRAALIAGSSSSAEKLERLRSLGLHLGLVDPYNGFAEAVLERTGQKGVDVVVDHIGGVLLNQTMSCTAIGGAIVNVGRFGGIKAEIDLNLHAARRLRLIGATFRSRSLDEHAAVVRAFLADHGAALADGSLAPTVDSVFPFDDLPAAVARSMNREQLGKIVIERAH